MNIRGPEESKEEKERFERFIRNIFGKALKTLSEKKVNRTEPIQWYYPSQREAVKSLYGVSLESKDCVEKGIRFVEVQVLKK